jgi:hypothetical protein
MQETNDKSNKELFNKWSLVSLAVEFGFIIALPLVFFALVGKWLDHKYGTSPWLTLSGIVLAIASTTIWMTKRIKVYIK